MHNRLLTYETRAGDAVALGERRLVPFSQVLHIRFPFVSGGLIWNRPVAVAVTGGDGQEQVLPIRDITRQVQIALLGGALLAGILFGIIISTQHKLKGSNHER